MCDQRLDLGDTSEMNLSQYKNGFMSSHLAGILSKRTGSNRIASSDPYVMTSNDDQPVLSLINGQTENEIIDEITNSEDYLYEDTEKQNASLARQRMELQPHERLQSIQSVTSGGSNTRVSKMRNIKQEINQIMTQIEQRKWRDQDYEPSNPPMVEAKEPQIDSLTFSPNCLKNEIT